MTRGWFGWVDKVTGRSAIQTAGPDAASSQPAAGSAHKSVSSTVERRAGREAGADNDAGRRERESVRSPHAAAVDREEAALLTQLERAPRDINALFGLLAYHSRRSDVALMAAYAHRLWDETDGEGGLWEHAAMLGRAADPDNPLYSPDPFAAYAAQLASLPAVKVLPPEQLAVSLEIGDTETGAENQAVSDLNADSDPDAAPDAHAALPRMRKPARLDGAPVFDTTSAPPQGLPAAFASLSLDMDAAPTLGERVKGAAKRWKGGSHDERD